MDLLIAKIIKYLNSYPYFDETYKILMWLLLNYNLIEQGLFSEGLLLMETSCDKSDLKKVLKVLGCKDFDALQETLCQQHFARLDQIRSRMIGVRCEDIVKDMEKDCADEDMLFLIEDIDKLIYNADRIILVGALYPLAIASEFQTDMTIFSKKVIQYKPDLEFNEEDLIIIISTTGRSAKYFFKQYPNLEAKTIVITQNKQLNGEKTKISDLTILVPGRYDGININYQIMKIFDLLRLSYYQRYYLKQIG